MSFIEVMLWVILIPITEFFVLVFYDWWKDRNKIDVGCDLCKKILHPRSLKKHKIKAQWLCKRCTDIVNAEIKAEAKEQEE